MLFFFQRNNTVHILSQKVFRVVSCLLTEKYPNREVNLKFTELSR